MERQNFLNKVFGSVLLVSGFTLLGFTQVSDGFEISFGDSTIHDEDIEVAATGLAMLSLAAIWANNPLRNFE